MPQPAIGADVHQTFDIHLHALAQIAFNLALSINHSTNTTKIFLGQILNLNVAIYLGFIEDRR